MTIRLSTQQSSRLAALALAVTSGLYGTAAHAQSNASGAIFGRTAAAPGTTVHIESAAAGFSRDIAVASDGRYRAGSLPVGTYKVTLRQNGTVVGERDSVHVNVGTSTEVSFGGSAGASAEQATDLEGIQVVSTAMPGIDVSSVDTRTVLTAEQLQRLPLNQSVNAAVLLAPGAVNADARYGNAVSLGGSSAAENQYYVNGFPVTNPLTGLGATSLPFNAIEQEQAFTVQVYNVFNAQPVQSIEEHGETGTGDTNLTYTQPLSYQTPRYLQFGIRYDL